MSAVSSLRRLVAAGLLACAAAAVAAGPSTLTVCSAAPPDGFDPTQFTSSTTRDMAGYPLYDQLLRVKRGTSELVPGLAERWELSADGRSITLFLRSGVRFHTQPWFTPTRTMNADDVVFSLRRLMDRKSPWLEAAKSGFEAWSSNGLADLVQAVERVDAQTVRLKLAKPSAPLLALLADDKIATVFSAEYGAQLLKSGKLEELNTKPIGTGPWLFRSYQKDAVLRLAAHPDHWAGRPAIDNLVFAMTPDGKVRAQRVKAGECLVGSYMRVETLGSFDGTPIKMVGGSSLITSYIAINTRRPFLSDQRLREALWLGLGRASFVQAVYAGRAQPAGSVLPAQMWSHDATLVRPLDVDRATALVKESGYDGRPITLSMAVGGSIDGKRAAELMQADWSRIGINLKIEMVEWAELLRRTAAGEYDLTHLNEGNGSDPDSFLTPNFSCGAVKSGGNRSGWCSPALDALLEQARVAQDRATRTKLYRDAQRIVFDAVPVIPTVYPPYYTAVSPRVKGFVASPLSDLDFRGVKVD